MRMKCKGELELFNDMDFDLENTKIKMLMNTLEEKAKNRDL